MMTMLLTTTALSDAEENTSEPLSTEAIADLALLRRINIRYLPKAMIA